MAKDFYSVLGVPRDATDKEIKAAYRKLARQLHPDVNPGDKSASDSFKRVNEAYDVIGDPKKRKGYDEFGEHWKHADELRKAGSAGFGREGNPFGGNGGGHSIFDLFAGASGGDFGGAGGSMFDMFGGGRSQSTVEGSVEVTLEDAYDGVTRRVRISGPAGSRTFEVNVPAGIKDGEKIRLNPDPQTRLLLKVRVLPSSRFSRNGDDLVAEVPVSYYDAVLGGEVEVPTMKGRIALTIPAGTQNGRSFRVPGRGMPKRGSAEFGDLIAKVKVKLPEEITEEHRRLFEQLRELDRSSARSDRR